MTSIEKNNHSLKLIGRVSLLGAIVAIAAGFLLLPVWAAWALAAGVASLTGTLIGYIAAIVSIDGAFLEGVAQSFQDWGR